MGSGSCSSPPTLSRSMYSTAKLPLVGRESVSGFGLRQSRSLVASVFGLLSSQIVQLLSEPRRVSLYDLSSLPASFNGNSLYSAFLLIS